MVRRLRDGGLDIRRGIHTHVGTSVAALFYQAIDLYHLTFWDMK